MLIPRILPVAGCLAFALTSTALAQIAPEQVWQSWQGLSTGMGYTLTATESRQGDRLVLDNVVMATTSDTMTATAPMGQIVMRDRGDGTVEVTMPPAYAMQMAINEPGRDPVQMEMNISQPGLTMVVSGTSAAQRYAYQAGSIGVSLGTISVKGEAVPMTMDVTLNGVTGELGLSADGPVRTDSTVNATGMDLAMSATQPGGDGTTDMKATIADLVMRFDGTIPANASAGAQLPELLAAGLNGTGSYSTGAIKVSAMVNERGQDVAVNATVSGSTTEVGITGSGLGYVASARDIDMMVSGSQIPFPDLRITLAEQALGLTIPMVKSDTPSDYALLLRLVDLALPASVWGMVDPMGQLPHDPATLVLDAKGKATLFMDLGTPEATQPGAVPGQFESVQIDALQLKAAGADLTGSGAFTFDNTDLQTIPGMPRPTGAVDLRLEGGNTLLDKLVAMGLVPQDQVMGFRMMLALFARPGEGPDTLTSRIEITPEGAIMANGQRIQ